MSDIREKIILFNIKRMIYKFLCMHLYCNQCYLEDALLFDTPFLWVNNIYPGDLIS